MTIQTVAADLEQDGIVHELAVACVNALREVADTATASRFIHLVAHQVAAVGEPTAESVAAHLRTTLTALQSSSAELRWAETAGRA